MLQELLSSLLRWVSPPLEVTEELTYIHTQIVTLPYPLLLQKSAREALSISLKGHIIIIDEAHNLLDAISSIHSSTIALHSLQLGRSQLGGYLAKFRNKLKGKNRVYVTQLVRVIDSLVEFLNGNSAGKMAEGEVQMADLMRGKGVDQINLFKLMRYLQESKIARKVERYAVFAEEQQHQQACSTSTLKSMTEVMGKKATATVGTPVLTELQSFLLALTSPAAEGRFFFSKAGEGDVSLKYLLLDPTHHFREIVEEARAVILAGGTMSPVSLLIQFL
jgi:chromosome transmission fidelity protein 1